MIQLHLNKSQYNRNRYIAADEFAGKNAAIHFHDFSNTDNS